MRWFPLDLSLQHLWLCRRQLHGWLRGWELTEAEEARIGAVEQPEVVVRERPLRLLVEVPTATDRLPLVEGRRLYSLRLQWRQWSLDKRGTAKLQRFGFPLVPDFGGTAHAYCGTTMDACLGDLLPWHRRPSHEDMLRAYRQLINDGLLAPETTVIAGDSAGGGLVVATLVALRQQGGTPLPAGGILLSPWCDLSGTAATARPGAG